MSLKTLSQTTRPSFLILTPICIFLGLSSSFASGADIGMMDSVLIIIAATLAHISVNMLNEYFDFESGLDLQTERTPFSGGSGALPDQPEMAAAVFRVGVGTLLAVIGIGIYFVIQAGMKLMPIGLIGVLVIVTYTQWLNRLPILCLIAPGLGFGTLMVVGTDVALTGSYDALPCLLSMIPFFLVNNLLLLNQYPDIKADAQVGRNTFPIAFGLKNSNRMYAAFSLATYLLILAYIGLGYLPGISAIAVIPAACSLYALSGALKYRSNLGEHPQYLAANVAACLLTPLLLGITVIVG